MWGKKKYLIEHFNDGKGAWVDYTKFNLGATGTGILFAIFTATGVPWWFPDKIPKLFCINPFYILAIIIILVIAAWIIRASYLIDRSRRSLNRKHILHNIAHLSRDWYSDICKLKTKGNKTPDIKIISNDICNLVHSYFKDLTKKDNIGVALRIAAIENEEIVYNTVGRAGLNLCREKTSEPLKATEGIARLLQDKDGSHGIQIIHDVEAAIKAKIYKDTDNDKKFDGEIKTVMVAPINGWDGEKQALLGILYITSPQKYVFSQKYTDPMGFIADTIANILASTNREFNNLNSVI